MKNLWEKHKKGIIAAGAVLCLLVAVFFLENGASGSGAEREPSDELSMTEQANSSENSDTSAETNDADSGMTKPTDKPDNTPAVSDVPVDSETMAPTVSAPAVSVTPPTQSPPPAKTPDPADAMVSPSPSGSEETVTGKEYACTLTISCATVLDYTDKLDPDKAELVPDDGIIYSGDTVFYGGESVFNLLRRVTKQNSIHFEYQYTPAYNTVYIEGIGNIYEFDCGDLSGWLYRVNGEFYSKSCSEYVLSPGDKVEILYSCDLGRDVGADDTVTSE
jgi:hypothetical protein